MTGYIAFEGRITALEWGRSVYTVLPLPDAVTEALGNTRRVEGEIADHPVNLALTRAPVIAQAFLWTGKSLLDRIGLAPGDPVEARLRPAPDSVVEMPEDLALALRQAEAHEAWDMLTPGKQCGLLYQVDTAKRAETRARRITALIASLRGSG